MSYHFYLEINSKQKPPVTVFRNNYTSNAYKMFRLAFRSKEHFKAFDNKSAKECLMEIDSALKIMKANPYRFKKYNPENGYGDYEGAYHFLFNFGVACLRYPKAKIGISFKRERILNEKKYSCI